ncbi:MAG: hypothetical protein LBR32_09390 [Propionibacteriaceae bacterium]|jgi:hypothetical protein|nr:hypothetical protein [Propionibacteriaceae bacterium]
MTENPPPTSADAPPPGWTPPPLSDQRWAAGVQPPAQRAAWEPAAPVSAKVDDYAAPKTKLLPLAIVAAVLAVALSAAFFLSRAPGAAATPSASPSSAQPTATPWGLAFSTPDEQYSGQWAILDHQWTDNGLSVLVKVEVDQGPLQLRFMAFNDATADAADSYPSTDWPGDGGTIVESGETRQGWVQFPLQHGDSTVLLADYYQDQLSALSVPQ